MGNSTLEFRIEQYADQFTKHNLFHNLLKESKLTAFQLATFLKSAEFLVSHTPVHLEKAARVSRACGLNALGDFFEKKWAEEQGHDEWARADLKLLCEKFGLKTSLHEVPATNDLVEYLDHLIEENPALYLAYILLAEYFIVLNGPSIVEKARQTLRLPPDALSVISNHVELDKSHVIDDMKEISEMLGEYADESSFLSALEKAIGLHENIYTQVALG